MSDTQNDKLNLASPEIEDTIIKLRAPTSPPSLTLSNDGRTILTITGDGKMVIGDGLSTDEATQEAARILAIHFEQYFLEHYVRKDQQNG